MNRLASDTTVIQSAVTINVSMGLRFGAQALIGMVLIFFESWKLSLVMLAVVPAIAFVAVAYGRFMKKVSKRYQAALAQASSVAQEALSSVRTVRSFAMEVREAKRYVSSVDESYGIGRQKALAYGLFGSIIGTVGQFAIILVLWYGGGLVIRGEMTLAALTSFLLYTIMIAACLGGLSDLFSSMMNALGSSVRVFQLLDRRPRLALTGGLKLDDVRGRIEFRQVSFAYPSRAESAVLDAVDLLIEPGSVVALCGPSGSGKSTVVGLIEKWYEPQQGTILLDGTPLSLVDASWWRRQVALVAQEPVLFACSIAENIGYGLAAVTPDAVEAAADTANAAAFIRAFPNGFDTRVGERGLQLSGGQKQRIAIARALLIDPKMLLLDEATSALDAESEHVVQEAIDRLMAERTTVVVAHRLSTVRGADCICVVSKGKIIERGRHEDLIAQVLSQLLEAGRATSLSLLPRCELCLRHSEILSASVLFSPSMHKHAQEVKTCIYTFAPVLPTVSRKGGSAHCVLFRALRAEC
uniref:Bile salt export pump n=3 Tax=Chrysotila carterae TaxID=13221 RepID=A0A7S4F8U8_CHRCT